MEGGDDPALQRHGRRLAFPVPWLDEAVFEQLVPRVLKPSGMGFGGVEMLDGVAEGAMPVELDEDLHRVQRVTRFQTWGEGLCTATGKHMLCNSLST